MGKTELRRQAQRLRRSAEWDPERVLAKRVDPSERWMESEQARHCEATYETAASCEACAQAQREASDATALCEKHLMAAMGLDP